MKKIVIFLIFSINFTALSMSLKRARLFIPALLATSAKINKQETKAQSKFSVDCDYNKCVIREKSPKEELVIIKFKNGKTIATKFDQKRHDFSEPVARRLYYETLKELSSEQFECNKQSAVKPKPDIDIEFNEDFGQRIKLVQRYNFMHFEVFNIIRFNHCTKCDLRIDYDNFGGENLSEDEAKELFLYLEKEYLKQEQFKREQ